MCPPPGPSVCPLPGLSVCPPPGPSVCRNSPDSRSHVLPREPRWALTPSGRRPVWVRRDHPVCHQRIGFACEPGPRESVRSSPRAHRTLQPTGKMPLRCCCLQASGPQTCPGEAAPGVPKRGSSSPGPLGHPPHLVFATSSSFSRH